MNPIRVATVGHLLKKRPWNCNEWVSDAETREALAGLTDDELSLFPKLIRPGLKSIRSYARNWTPPLSFIMAHSIP